MKTSITFKVSCLALSIFLQSFNAIAAVNFEVNAGAEQDSNLNIVELDKHSHESDLAALLGLKIDASCKPTDKFSLSGGYSYNSKNYQKNTNFNLAIHQLYADANYEFDVVTAGASHHYADALLDGKSFLELNQTSFYVSKLINNSIYLRAATNLQEKRFDNINDRNANNVGFAGDVFLFFNSGKTFVSASVTKDKEDANAKQFDYTGTEYKTKISHKFMVGSKENKLQLGWRYLERDYSGITPEIKTQRYDSGHTIEANWEVAFTPKVSLEAKIENGKYSSNLTTANYSENQASITLKARF